MSNNLRETKQRFTLRKNKRYKNVVSVGLGLFIAMGVGVLTNEAHASDTVNPIVKTENPATNAPEAQPKATEEAISSIEKTGEVAGNVDVNVDKSKLDEAVENAKNNGLKVEKEAVKDLGTAKSIEEAREKQVEVNKDYKNQETNLNKKTEDYKKEVAEHKVEVEKIVEYNTKLEEKYKKEVSNYNADVKATNAYNAEVQAKYDRELAKFNEDVARINKENENAKVEYEIAYQKYLTNVNTITEENKQSQAEYERKLAEYNTEKPKVEAENAKLKSDYEKAKAESEKLAKEIEAINREINTSNAQKRAEYERKLAEYKRLKAEYDRKLSELELNKNKDGYLSEVVSQNFVFNTEPEAKSNIEGNYTYVERTTKNVTSTQIANMTSVDLEDRDNILVTYTNLKNSRYKNINISKTTYEIQNITGNKLRVYVMDDPTMGIQLGVGNYLAPKAKVKIKFYDKNNNIINFSEENPALIGLSSLTNWEQVFDINNRNIEAIEDYNFDFVKITGSSVEEHRDGIYSDSNNMETSRGARYEYTDTDNVESSLYYYLGGAGKITRGNSIEFTVAKYNGDKPREWNGTWVSFTSKIATVTDIPYAPAPPEEPNYQPEVINTPKPVTPPIYKPLPEKPTPPTPKEIPNAPAEPNYKPLPEKPTLDEFKVLPPEPTTPNYKEVPNAPEVPTVKYHYVTFDVETNVYKEVKNSSNIDINKNLVPKLSEVKWELKTEDLPSNREETTVFEITDNLPAGFDFDLEKSREASKLFEVSYNKETHTVFYKGNNELIKKINADLTKELITPFPVAIGKVVNDGGSYENNFKLNINNKYTKYSNTVVIYTPGNDPKKPRPPYPTIPGQPGENPTPNDNLINPEKENLNKDGVDINGTVVPLNSTNYYVLKWDLDQYKGIKASAEDIAKGFYFIDDYPEEALNLNEKEVKIVDSTGKAVVGVKVEAFESVEKATEEVKGMLEKAKITPKGAFQLFRAENAEQFYNDYVTKGISITITNPMVVKKAFAGDYENKAFQVDFGNGYETDVVVNNVPKVEPKKENTDKDGVNIDGKSLLPGSVNYYKLLWDLDQYKGIKASKEDVSKGFYFVDDYPEEALEINENGVTLVDSTGKSVVGIKVEAFESLEKATDEVKAILSSVKITPKGAFQLFRAENPEKFYTDYVTKGISITITNPMVVKKAFAGDYENKAFQVDFGNGYETDVVVNNVPKLDPQKDVVIGVTHNKESLDGKTLELGKVFNYHLVGAKLPTNRAEEINQYGFVDNYDEKGDQYDGVYLAFSTVDVTLKDGSIVKKGTEITKYTTQVLDTENGKVSIEVDKNFLEKVSKDSEFQVDIYLQMKRVASGEFKNTFINTINGYEVSSNTVVTNTPEPPKPEEPKKPTPPSPEKPKKVLPKTSAATGKEQNNNAGALASGLVTLGVLTLVRKRKVK